MKKSLLWSGLVLLVLLAATPAMAGWDDGKTSQCWEFSSPLIEVLPPYLYVAAPTTVDNVFGAPGAMINDISGKGIQRNDNGYVVGDEFKLILDIPNRPELEGYKDVTVTLKYQGQISFFWASDIDTGELFTVADEGQPTVDPTSGWIELTRKFHFDSKNPREELIVLGLKGIDLQTPAMLDSICVDTICVPEPATLTLLTLGAGLFAFRKKN